MSARRGAQRPGRRRDRGAGVAPGWAQPAPEPRAQAATRVPPPRPGSPGSRQGSGGGWERAVSGLGGPPPPGPGHRVPALGPRLFARATPRGLATTRPRGRRRCSHPKFSPKAYAWAALCPPGPGESLKERPYSEKSRGPAPHSPDFLRRAVDLLSSACESASRGDSGSLGRRLKWSQSSKDSEFLILSFSKGSPL